ncbi:hypothetical protein J3F83DRAFT_389393 [Trichoderma novae-zelandiae]
MLPHRASSSSTPTTAHAVIKRPFVWEGTRLTAWRGTCLHVPSLLTPQHHASDSHAALTTSTILLSSLISIIKTPPHIEIGTLAERSKAPCSGIAISGWRPYSRSRNRRGFESLRCHAVPFLPFHLTKRLVNGNNSSSASLMRSLRLRAVPKVSNKAIPLGGCIGIVNYQAQPSKYTLMLIPPPDQAKIVAIPVSSRMHLESHGPVKLPSSLNQQQFTTPLRLRANVPGLAARRNAKAVAAGSNILAVGVKAGTCLRVSVYHAVRPSPIPQSTEELTICLNAGSLAADAGNRLRGVDHDLLCHAVGRNRAAEVLRAGCLDHAGLEHVEVGGVDQRNGQSAVSQGGLAVGRDSQRIGVVVALGAESDVGSLHRGVLRQRDAGKEANGEQGAEELHLDLVGRMKRDLS